MSRAIQDEEPAGLTFDEANHRYAYDGRPVVSVTQALSLSGIVDGGVFPPGAAERGTAVHLACQFDDEGSLDEETVAENIRPYLEGWRRFRAESNFRHIPGGIEQRVYSALGFAGTIDRIGTFGEGPLWIIDIKSGVKHRSWPIQTAAYSLAYCEMNGLASATVMRATVQVTRDATYQLIPYRATRDFNVFRAALTIAMWRREHGDA